MPSSKYLFAVLSFAITSLPLINSQLVSSLPDCIQDCIEQSPDINCSTLDVACLCRASSGNFLPDTITCMHAKCDNNLDNNLLLTPLQLACQLAGSPIPSSAIRNAQNIGSSLAQSTTTITMHDSSSSLSIPTPTSQAPVQSDTSSSGFTLPTKNPTTQTSTLYPYLGTKPSTQGIGPSSSSSDGSVTQVTGTKTQTPTGTGTGTGSGTQTGQSQASTSTSTGSKSAAAPPNSVETNSSPFQDGNAGSKNGIGWLFGLSLGFALGGVWL